MTFRTGLVLFCDVLLCVIVYPFLIIFLTPVVTYRFLVVLFAKIFYPTHFPSNLLDQTVAFDFFENEKYPLIFSAGSMITVHGPVSVPRMRERWRKQFLESRDSVTGKLLYPKLSVNIDLIGGYIFFKPLKEVNGDEVFREIQLDPKDLDDYKMKFLTAPYKKDGPLWEVVIIKLNQETKMLYRFHHIIADGYTQLCLLNESMRPEGRKIPVQKEPEYGFKDRVISAIRFPRLATLYTFEIFQMRKGIPFSATKNENCLTTSTHIYFSDLKMIHRKTEANFLSINLALYAGVLRRIFQGKPPGDYVSVQTAMPWPNHPAREGKMGNHFSGSLIRLPLKDMSGLDRVREIDQTIKVFQEREMHKIIWWFFVPLVGIFPSKMTATITTMFQRMLGVKLTFSTLLSFEDFDYEIDGSPVMAVNTLVTRCGYTSVLLGSTIIYNERCEVTFVGIPAIAETQAAMNKIVNEYYLEEIDSLLEEVAAEKGFV